MRLSRASNNYANDANGNTTTGGGRTNTWDSQNRLVKCVTGTGAGQKTSTFTYGADGLRRTMNVQTGNVAATAQYSETQYILDAQNVVQENTRQKSGSGGTWTAWTTVTYLMGPSGPMARLTANATDARWYCYDGLGSVLAEVDVNGVAQGTRKYDVYGATRSYTGTPMGRQAFVGQLGHATDDETGLTYMRARYYDNVAGRFISEDPSKNGVNWFAYCNNNPGNYVDGSGKEGENAHLADLLKKLIPNGGYLLAAANFYAIMSIVSALIAFNKTTIPGLKPFGAGAALALGMIAVGMYAVALGANFDDVVRDVFGGTVIGGLVGGVLATLGEGGKLNGSSIAAGGALGCALPVIIGTAIYSLQLIAALVGG